MGTKSSQALRSYQHTSSDSVLLNRSFGKIRESQTRQLRTAGSTATGAHNHTQPQRSLTTCRTRPDLACTSSSHRGSQVPGGRLVSFLVSFMYVYLGPSPSTPGSELGSYTSMASRGRSSVILKNGRSAASLPQPTYITVKSETSADLLVPRTGGVGGPSVAGWASRSSGRSTRR